jgi:hypothetical protein
VDQGALAFSFGGEDHTDHIALPAARRGASAATLAQGWGRSATPEELAERVDHEGYTYESLTRWLS